MDTIGLIVCSPDLKEMRIKCLNCSIESDISDWDKFRNHVEIFHDNRSVDNDLAKENILVETSPNIKVKKLKLKIKPARKPKLTLMTRMQVSFMRPTYRLEQLVIVYRMQSCLWNISHSDFADIEKRNEAYASMKSYMYENALISFSNDELKKTIQRLHKQYVWVATEFGENKLRGLAALCFEKCTFLNELLDELLHEPTPEENDSINTIKLNFKEENILTTTFISAYANYPQLYNSTMFEYTSLESRAEAFREIAETILPLTMANETEVYMSIQRLQRWLYRNNDCRLKRKSIFNPQELEYVTMCGFLPAYRTSHPSMLCTYCRKTISGDYNFQWHLYHDHQVGALPYICCYCSRRFGTYRLLGQHKMECELRFAHIFNEPEYESFECLSPPFC
ncbi:uncharacterized protein [Drosophila bipectinata]|uniref:uncharacterized protein isoform X2 n=1 Tax=Drosophila bipectinata TaxID=42026 RepID=UPI0038B3CC4A